MTQGKLLRMFSRHTPSPAMVVACLALLVALGGTSYAAIRLPANSVGTKQLKRNAVTGPKIKSNAVTGAHVIESSLAKVPLAAAADTAASAPVARLDYASAAVLLPASFAVTRATVNCPSGLNATGGGAKVTDPTSGYILDTNPVGKAGWEATGQSNTAQNMTVYVICAQAASTTP